MLASIKHFDVVGVDSLRLYHKRFSVYGLRGHFYFFCAQIMLDYQRRIRLEFESSLKLLRLSVCLRSRARVGKSLVDVLQKREFII